MLQLVVIVQVVVLVLVLVLVLLVMLAVVMAPQRMCQQSRRVKMQLLQVPAVNTTSTHCTCASSMGGCGC